MSMKKITPESPEARSADLVSENIEKLKALFPELITEGPEGLSVNVDALKQLVGDLTVTDCDEKYGLNWFGKRRARQLALTPSTGTLRPCPEESEDWDTTQNLFIEGDNLEVLKLLQKSYAGKVKLIYIDPPYNTGKDFVYKDDFRDNIKNYKRLTGQVDEEGSPLTTNPETSGRFHTDWLNMMYPRLKLARSLLKEDGILFVSIDDREAAHLRLILNEIFGEENSLTKTPTTLIWPQSGTTAGHFARAHEYILAYAKDKESCPYFRLSEQKEGEDIIKHGALKKISSANPASEITFPAGVEFEGRNAVFEGAIGDSEKQYIKGRMIFKDGKLAEPVTIKAGWAMRDQILRWLEGEKTYDSKGQKIVRFYFNSRGILWYEKERGTIHPKTILNKTHVGNTKEGSSEIKDLFGGEKLFDFPKPSRLIAYLASFTTNAHDIVLDFFAGSGTTGHAVMAQNAADGGNRRYILVQLPEPLDPENKDQRAGAEFCDKLGKPRTIAELAKERLRRAAKKIKEEHPDWDGDTGFRVFKLDSSNIKAWNPQPEDLEASLLASVDHLEGGRTEADLLYELLLKLGLDLCVPIEQKEIAGKTVHAIGGGVLMTCLAERITVEETESLGLGIVEWHKALNPAGDTTCVFRDSAFENDVAKTNLAAILEQAGIASVRSL